MTEKFHMCVVVKTTCTDKVKYNGHFKLKFEKQRQETILIKKDMFKIPLSQNRTKKVIVIHKNKIELKQQKF